MSYTVNSANDLISTAEKLTAANLRNYVRGLPMKARLALRLALQLPCGSLTIQMPDGRTVKIEGHEPGPDAVWIGQQTTEQPATFPLLASHWHR